MEELSSNSGPSAAPSAEMQQVGTEVKESFSPRRYLKRIGYGVALLLLPVAVLIFLSQNALPGSFFYPAKRGMEDALLAAASLNPQTKTLFHIGLADQRLSEAEKVLLASGNTASLSDFLSEVETTQQEILAMTDAAQKDKLQQQLDEKITQYKQQLVSTRDQLIAQNPTVYQAVPTQAPAQSASTQAVTQPPTVNNTTQVVNNTTVVNNIVYVYPTSTPAPAVAVSQPNPTQTPVSSENQCQGSTIAVINCTINSLGDLTTSASPTSTALPTRIPTATPVTPTPTSIPVRSHLNGDQPTVTPIPASSTVSSTQDDCRNNPVAPPDGYTWKANCSLQCNQNSDCPASSANTKDGNWCYGFTSGSRCLLLKHN